VNDSLHPLVAAIMDACGWRRTNPEPIEAFGDTDPPPRSRTPLEQARAHGIPQVHTPARARAMIEAFELHAAAEVDVLDLNPDDYTACVALLCRTRPHWAWPGRDC
jgi:hypothetical protein